MRKSSAMQVRAAVGREAGPDRSAARACYLCGVSGNPIIASEPMEIRGNLLVLGVDLYRFARCRGCGLLYVDAEVSPDHLDALYRTETIDSAAEAAGVSDPTSLSKGRIPEFTRHWAAMKKARAPHPGDKLLDVGCQTGDFGAVAAEDDVVPCGVELSTSYADECSRRWPETSMVFESLDAAAREGTAYSYVSAFETLEHLIDPLSALAQLRSMMTADAIVAISVPSSDYFHLKYRFLSSRIGRPLRTVLTRRKASYAHRLLPHTHLFNFSPKALAHLLAKADLMTMSISPTGWHGRPGLVMRPLSRAVFELSGRRVCLAPCVFAIAAPRYS